MDVVLSIADSDSSGGSGIQADLKTFESFDLFGATVVTAVTAKNTVGVMRVEPIESDLVRSQIDAVMNDFDVKAIKIGMLYSKDNIIEIGKFLEEIKSKNIPIILDPVAISKSASKLLKNDAIEELKKLFEFATLITPNPDEFKEFFKELESAKEFANSSNTYILIKDLTNSEGESIDVLIKPSKDVKNFKTQKLNSTNTLGTGSSFSSAIASLLATDRGVDESIFIAKKFIYHSIKSAPEIGNGDGPINHKLGRKSIDSYLA